MIGGLTMSNATPTVVSVSERPTATRPSAATAGEAAAYDAQADATFTEEQWQAELDAVAGSSPDFPWPFDVVRDPPVRLDPSRTCSTRTRWSRYSVIPREASSVRGFAGPVPATWRPARSSAPS